MALSTPLKNKSPVNATLTTPKPTASQLSITSTPFTEGKTRRTAATKADKYIDIVTRRLAEVPANGSTPKSMKIASKLISEATPNSRRTILLSQSLSKSEIPLSRKSEVPQCTPSKPLLVEVPAATPVSVRKRKRAAKIHQMFETSLISLATAASSEIGSLSPATIGKAPSTITKTRLNQTFSTNEPVKIVSPILKKTQSPVKRSQKASPVKGKKTSPHKEPSREEYSHPRASNNIPSVATTPKAPVVEFVAPRSALRSSKRPRKLVDTSIYNEDVSTVASPATKKQAKFTDASIFPTVSINSQTQVRITPQTPAAIVPAAPVIQISAKVSNVPTIIVPLTASKVEEFSSNEDLTAIESTSKRTPLRVQPSRTPTRNKSAIPSLSNYSAATKIAVIEVAKNLNSNTNTNNSVLNSSSATPKVEPWTSKFIQKESSAATISAPSVNLSKAGLSVNIKPVDTSKISGLSGSSGTAAVPIVPRFPLNLANISNITKSSTTLLKSELSNNTNTTSDTTSNNTTTTFNNSSISVVVPESPLSRAKRIDSENSSKEEKMKSMMELKKKSMLETKSVSVSKVSETTIMTSETYIKLPSSSNIAAKTITVTAVDNNQNNIQSSSKLPVKPKSSLTVLPSPKVPSRLAEAFSGIDSELPPIDIGLVDDERILKSVLSGSKNNGVGAESNGFINPKMKKQPTNVTANSNSNSNTMNNSETQTNSQLHRTAVLNSAARKVNGAATETTKEKPPSTKTTGTQQQQHNKVAPLPSTPKPPTSSAKLDTSSPSFPEILSE